MQRKNQRDTNLIAFEQLQKLVWSLKQTITNEILDISL